MQGMDDIKEWAWQVNIIAETTESSTRPTGGSNLDVQAIRREFPILSRELNGHPLVYLDNAASTQRPACVIDAVSDLYRHDYANIHRGVHTLSQISTRLYEDAREKVRSFLNASEQREIIFTRGTTESINLVAQSWGRANLSQGDEIIISHMEHHSNIVPWQILCEQTGAKLRVIPISDHGTLMMDELDRQINGHTRLISLVHVSNALGTINPVKAVIEKARNLGIHVLIDGAQAVSHLPVDVTALDCDFYCFSGHKIFGPTGIGVLYGKAELLESMPPWQGGGDMISSVTFEKTTYNELPYKFEAGTPHIAGVVGLGAALDYVNRIGLESIMHYELELLSYATGKLKQIEGARLIGTAPCRASVLSFVLDDIHPHDIGTILDQEGVAVRTGHHCAQPVMDRFDVPATIRASFSFYNTIEEIDALVAGLGRAREFLGGYR
jgi:cysteine desulfurase/selenocysteine lyase